MYVKVDGKWYSPARGDTIQLFLTRTGREALQSVLDHAGDEEHVSVGLFPDNNKQTQKQRSALLTVPEEFEDLERYAVDKLKH